MLSPIESVTLGDQGAVTIPRAVLDQHGWVSGTELMVLETSVGCLVTSTEEARSWLRARFEGRDLVEEILQERRAETTRESVKEA